MTVLTVIPARLGSARIPAKPLADICGEPLIARVYKNAVKMRRAGRVVVAADSEEVAAAAAAAGAETVMTPETLASGSDRVLYALRKLSSTAGVVVNLQGDEPLMDTVFVDRLVEAALGDEPADVFTASFRADPERAQSSSAVKAVLDRKGYALYFSRSPVPYGASRYLIHQGVYVWRRKSLERFHSLEPTEAEKSERLEQLRALENGMRIRVFLSSSDSPGVDTPEDLERVRGIFEKEGRRV